jgi:hypothetical protein
MGNLPGRVGSGWMKSLYILPPSGPFKQSLVHERLEYRKIAYN